MGQKRPDRSLHFWIQNRLIVHGSGVWRGFGRTEKRVLVEFFQTVDLALLDDLAGQATALQVLVDGLAVSIFVGSLNTHEVFETKYVRILRIDLQDGLGFVDVALLESPNRHSGHNQGENGYD